MKNVIEKKTNDDSVVLGKTMSNTQRLLAFIAIVSVYFFYCYNFMVGTFVKPTMIAALDQGGFGFTFKQTESIFAVMSFATIIGTFIFGTLASKIGKKKALVTIALSIAVTTFLPLLAPSSITLWKIGRFTTGLALGGVFGTAMPLAAEMFPQKYRGKLAAILTSLFSLAMIFGGKLYGALGDANWKILIYTCIIPEIIGAVLVFFLVPDDSEYTKKLNQEAKEKGERINYFSMYKGVYLWIGLGVILLSGANFVAYSSFSNNATTYLRKVVGYSAAVAGSIYSLQGIGQLIGYNVWGFIADKFGRKIPAVGMLASALAIFIFAKLGSNDVASFKAVAFFIGLCVGYSGHWGAYYTELFPKKFSTLAPGISFNGGRIISTFALPAIAGLADSPLGMIGIFRVSLGVFIAGTIVWLFLPETLSTKVFNKQNAASEA